MRRSAHVKQEGQTATSAKKAEITIIWVASKTYQASGTSDPEDPMKYIGHVLGITSPFSEHDMSWVFEQEVELTGKGTSAILVRSMHVQPG